MYYSFLKHGLTSKVERNNKMVATTDIIQFTSGKRELGSLMKYASGKQY